MKKKYLFVILKTFQNDERMVFSISRSSDIQILITKLMTSQHVQMTEIKPKIENISENIDMIFKLYSNLASVM